ncbi:MAG: FtsQ-type POTRA domain-containing protein [Chloroflexi bacterium]|nr:FtsQ-type POTRA domain-containing protein [Chloroflexota bacterium]
MKLPIRRRATPPRLRPIQRASAGLSAIRAVAAMGLLAASGALYGLSIREEFRLDPQQVTIDGAVHTTPESVMTNLGLGSGARPNLFRLRTIELAAGLRQLPAVLDADLNVMLPDRLAVRLTERTPILVWIWGEDRLLVDLDGVLFARVDPGSEPTVGLPVVTDRRPRPVPPVEGERLDDIDLSAVRQLAAVTPAMLGSSATTLELSVDDTEGFTLDARPDLWHAVFGFYTARLRSPDLIPAQVQCLAALLGPNETAITTVVLAPGDDRCGSFRSRPGASILPGASGSPAPSGSPGTSGLPGSSPSPGAGATATEGPTPSVPGSSSGTTAP